jgi:predicted AAA+ superfamily ATPase
MARWFSRSTLPAVIRRSSHVAAVRRLLRENRVVALVGARQVGKTTLAHQVAAAQGGPVTTFDLESARDLARLDDPLLALEPLRGLVILDEVQRRPEIFPTLRVLADRPRGARFLVLGSASPALLRQSSETLAGRIAFHELGGLSLDEVGARRAEVLWLRGGFPRSFVAATLPASLRWRQGFIDTFLERDLPQLGVRIAAPTLRRFWSMLAHVHGQISNWSELGRSMGVSDMTVRHYVEVLGSTFMVRALPPWFENVSKRQVKAPKLYLRDTGLLHALLDIADARQLANHPKVGASWEGFCVEAVIARLGARREQCYFWATHTGAELDLLVVTGRRRHGFEIKRTVAPRVTPSMRTAMSDLKLDTLSLIHAGRDTFPLGKGIRAIGMPRLLEDL